MTASPSPVQDGHTEQAEERTVCPACRTVIRGGTTRCTRCFARFAEVPPLSARQTAELIAEHDERISRARENRRRKRLIGAGAALVLVLVAVWILWPRDPSPLPVPASSVLSTESGSDRWEVAGGDLAGTRRTGAAVDLGRDLSWSVDLGSAAASAPVTDGTRVYVTTRDSRLMAIDGATGDLLWEHELSNPPFGSPTVAGDRLFLAHRGGAVEARDTATGSVLWVYATRMQLAAPIIVTDGVAYAFGRDGLWGFDAEIGEPLWEVEFEAHWYNVPPVVEGRYIAVTTSDRLIIFDRLTGQELYWYEFARAQPFAVTIADDVVIAASARLAAAVSVDSRRPWWEPFRNIWFQLGLQGWLPQPEPAPSIWLQRDTLPLYQPALADDALIFAGEDGSVRSVDRSSGETLWEVRLGEDVASAPTLTASGLLVTSSRELLLIDPAEGTTLATRVLDDPTLMHAIVTDEHTFVTSASGRLMALGR